MPDADVAIEGDTVDRVREAIASAADGVSRANVIDATGITSRQWHTAIKALLAGRVRHADWRAPRSSLPPGRRRRLMHPFHDYLCQQLDNLLKKRGVIVFYDSRREFEPFFDRELQETGTGYDGLPRVFVKERLTFVARHEGSFFALRNAVEPIADLDKPEPLIVYLPGIDRDRQTSVLMELEKSGTAYEPQLKRLALNVLRKRFTDGQIDEMLRPASVGYDDIVSFLHQGEEGQVRFGAPDDLRRRPQRGAHHPSGWPTRTRTRRLSRRMRPSSS